MNEEAVNSHKGNLFDVEAVKQQTPDPERTKKLSDPEYQKQISQNAVDRMFERYGETFNELKYL